MDEPEALVEVVVVPRAARDAVGGLLDGVVRVHVTRPPADGEANEAVIRLLARALHVAPSALELVAGRRSRHKRVRVRGLSPAEVRDRLAPG